MIKDNQTKLNQNPEKNLPKILPHQGLRRASSQKHSLLPNNSPPLVNKQQILQGLQNSFKNKLTVDEKVKQKLYEEEIKKVERQKRIRLDLEQINKQNTVWISKLNDYLKLVQNKKQLLQIGKSMKEEKDLITQYNKLVEEEQKVRLVKTERSKLEHDHWSQIAKQKQKLSHIMHQNQKKLFLIARTKNHQTGKSEPVKPPEQTKKQDDSKKLRKSKNIEELKELGRKYLEFAKNAEKSKSERRLFKVQNKSIDYGNQMKHLIKLKVDDLSKYPEPVPDQTLSTRRKKFLKNTLASTDSLNFKNITTVKPKDTKKNK